MGRSQTVCTVTAGIVRFLRFEARRESSPGILRRDPRRRAPGNGRIAPDEQRSRKNGTIAAVDRFTSVQEQCVPSIGRSWNNVPSPIVAVSGFSPLRRGSHPLAISRSIFAFVRRSVSRETIKVGPVGGLRSRGAPSPRIGRRALVNPVEIALDTCYGSDRSVPLDKSVVNVRAFEPRVFA